MRFGRAALYPPNGATPYYQVARVQPTRRVSHGYAVCLTKATPQDHPGPHVVYRTAVRLRRQATASGRWRQYPRRQEIGLTAQPAQPVALLGVEHGGRLKLPRYMSREKSWRQLIEGGVDPIDLH